MDSGAKFSRAVCNHPTACHEARGRGDLFHLPRLHRIAALLLALVAMACLPVAAQDASTGALNGVFRDPSGAVIPAAQLTLRNIATGQQVELQSDLGVLMS